MFINIQMKIVGLYQHIIIIIYQILMKLTELKSGERAEIIGCECNDTSVKLMEMGLIPGEVIEMHEPAPLGDPIRLSVMSGEISLRKSEAEVILIKKI